MSLLNQLIKAGHSCTVNISNGEYIDISNAGFLGISQKRLSSKMNNGIIAGIPCNGRTQLIDTILYDAANSGNPVVYVRNKVGNQQTGNYGAEIECGILGTQAVIIDISKPRDGMNLFKGMSLDCLTDFLIEIMSNYVGVDDHMKDFCIIWYNKIFEALKLTVPKEKFSINKMGQYTSGWLKKVYDDSYQNNRISRSEYANMNDELQKISTMYQTQMMKFINFSKMVETSRLARLLSGSVTVKDIYDREMTLLVNLYEEVCPKESAIFLKLLLKRLTIEETLNSSGAVCMFEDCNIKDDAMLFLKLLKTGQMKECSGSIYFTERNITWWSENLSRLNEHPANYCNAFFIFRQNMIDDLKFWSALSGSTKKIEVSYNTAPMALVHPLAPSSWINIILNCCSVYTGSSSREVDTYHVEEQEIDNLNDKSCIVIIKMKSGIYNRKVTWDC